MSAPLAARIAAELGVHFPAAGTDRHMRNGLALAEEAGAVVKALRRYLGLARCAGPLEEVADELADLAITVYITAHYLGIDMHTAIEGKAEVLFARGFKDPPGWDHGYHVVINARADSTARAPGAPR